MNRSNKNRNAAAKMPGHSRKLSKPFVVLLSVVLLVSIAGGATLAYLIAPGGTVTNSFTPGVVGCVVNYGDTGYTVSLSERTNTPAFVRISFVATWQDSSGNVYYADTTSVQPILTNKWNNHDGIYYYPYELVPGGKTTTEPFATGFTYKDDASVPAGYTLKVDIIADAIQSVGTTDADGNPAYMDAWASAINGN